MCVTIIFHKFLRDYPLIIGNNRDELVNRRFSPPEIIHYNPLIFAPKDIERGGTWIGINEYKIFVNILNRWTGNKDFFGSENYISRGQLVLDILRLNSLKKIIKYLEKINPNDYLPFHLIVSDIDKLYVAVHDGNKIDIMEINKKIFIIGNIYPFDNWEKYNFGYNFLKNKNLKDYRDIINALKELLKINNKDKNIPSLDYAVNQGHFRTTSSSIITINKSVSFMFLNGFPCNPDTKYIEYKNFFKN